MQSRLKFSHNNDSSSFHASDFDVRGPMSSKFNIGKWAWRASGLLRALASSHFRVELSGTPSKALIQKYLRALGMNGTLKEHGAVRSRSSDVGSMKLICTDNTSFRGCISGGNHRWYQRTKMIRRLVSAARSPHGKNICKEFWAISHDCRSNIAAHTVRVSVKRREKKENTAAFQSATSNKQQATSNKQQATSNKGVQ